MNLSPAGHDRAPPLVPPIPPAGSPGGAVRNVLFVMSDQLRWDHVSAYGRSPVPTPNIDRIASAGVRFDRAFVQGPVCGPSRMSYYTGRYVSSHGVTWNRVPLSARERTLGDYLRAAGRRAVLAGKTHVLPDSEALARYGIEIGSERGALLREGGFEPIERFDGHSPPDRRSGYADFLRAHGYAGEDPWSEYAISMIDARGVRVSGWNMRNLHLPARVRAEHSETAYLTDRAIRFVEEQGAHPWVLHLSYVKPHWPYVAPAPWHGMFQGRALPPPVRAAAERIDEHPVVGAFRALEESRNFSDDERLARIRPAYLGLIAELDHHIGRLLDRLEALGRMRDTLIVFCADHGDFMGDHWLAEKELFHDTVLRVPMLVADPDLRADATRGTASDRMVECIDVLPTILDALSVPGAGHLLEGRSMLPLLRGPAPSDWRDAVFAEADYAFRPVRWALGRGPSECRGWMVRTARHKYVHWQGFRPQLFDLEADPDELVDLGADPRFAAERERLRERLFDWITGLKLRTTMSDEDVAHHTDGARRAGILIGRW